MGYNPDGTVDKIPFSIIFYEHYLCAFFQLKHWVRWVQQWIKLTAHLGWVGKGWVFQLLQSA